MTDGDLRDRIASVLGTVEVVLDGWDYLNDTSRFLLADAVIRELGLRQEWGLLDDDDSGAIYDTEQEAKARSPLPGESLKTRYATEWHQTHPMGDGR